MRKILFIAVPLTALVIGFYFVFITESRDFTNYQKVQVGMSSEEVEAILGPGTLVNQNEVPGIVVAVNPRDAEESAERSRRSGGSPPTARDYPTRIKPVVEGDVIFLWLNSKTGERILVAFKNGKACEKHYYDPNYL